MRFLFDANVPRKAQRAIQTFYKAHHFLSASVAPFNPNMPDLQLFEVAATEKVDALITHDVAQMKGLDRRDERKKCFECGIHWLGLPHQNRATGKNRASSAAGTFISNLGYAIQTFESASEPTAILLLPSPAGLQSESPYPQIVKP